MPHPVAVPQPIAISHHYAGAFIRLPVALATTIPELIRALDIQGIELEADGNLSGQVTIVLAARWDDDRSSPVHRQILVNTLHCYYPHRRITTARVEARHP